MNETQEGNGMRASDINGGAAAATTSRKIVLYIEDNAASQRLMYKVIQQTARLRTR